jgi:hypothetical protein
MGAVRLAVGMAAVGGVLGGAGMAWAQCACEVPVLPGPSASIGTSSIGTSCLPVVSSPVVDLTPAPVVVYHPVVASPVVAPAIVTPVVAYRPVVPVVSVSPTVVYRPVATEVLSPVPVLVGKPAIIRTKVYYPGEPIRNLIKALTP